MLDVDEAQEGEHQFSLTSLSWLSSEGVRAADLDRNIQPLLLRTTVDRQYLQRA